MGRLTPGAVAPTHDLIRLREPAALTAESPLPAWAIAALQRVPWVVVRRGRICGELIPVGVRGPTRAQRFAAWLPFGEIVDQLAPEDLSVPAQAIEQQRRDAVPALAALACVAPVLRRHGQPWGAGGSVGFELASGVWTATPSSDLDLVIRQQCRLAPSDAAALWAALTAAAAPTRVDVLLETPHGGVALADLAARPAQVLLRAADGPRLVADPWLDA